MVKNFNMLETLQMKPESIASYLGVGSQHLHLEHREEVLSGVAH